MSAPARGMISSLIRSATGVCKSPERANMADRCSRCEMRSVTNFCLRCPCGAQTSTPHRALCVYLTVPWLMFSVSLEFSRSSRSDPKTQWKSNRGYGHGENTCVGNGSGISLMTSAGETQMRKHEAEPCICWGNL